MTKSKNKNKIPKDKNSKVIKITHIYPDEPRVDKKKLILSILMFLALCVFVLAVIVKGKEAFINKEIDSNHNTDFTRQEFITWDKGKNNFISLTWDNEKNDFVNLTWDDEICSIWDNETCGDQ